MADVKMALQLGEARLELQGDQAFVEGQLKKLLPLVKGDSGEHAEARPAAPTAEKASSGQRPQSIRGFFEVKKPGNAYEAMAVALYHRLKAEGKPELSGDEIKTAMSQGRHRPPESFAQALTDCRRRYGYIEPGSKKGFWKLSHSGETVVDFDLPRNAGKA